MSLKKIIEREERREIRKKQLYLKHMLFRIKRTLRKLPLKSPQRRALLDFKRYLLERYEV